WRWDEEELRSSRPGVPPPRASAACPETNRLVRCTKTPILLKHNGTCQAAPGAKQKRLRWAVPLTMRRIREAWPDPLAPYRQSKRRSGCAPSYLVHPRIREKPLTGLGTCNHRRG